MLLTMLIDEKATPEQIPAEMRQRMLAGSPAQIAEQVQTRVFGAGVDGLIINLPNGSAPGAVTAAVEALRPVVIGTSGRAL